MTPEQFEALVEMTRAIISNATAPSHYSSFIEDASVTEARKLLVVEAPKEIEPAKEIPQIYLCLRFNKVCTTFDQCGALNKCRLA